MAPSVKLQRGLMIVLMALLVAIGAVLLGNTSSRSAAPTPEFAGPRMPAGLAASNFALVDQAGHRVRLSRLRGRVVVLTFIHSLCRDACPLMVEQIKGAFNLLPDNGRSVPAIGVSVAPGEDTAKHRRAFLARHEMTGRLAFVSGSPAQLRPVWHAYFMQPVAPHIDHSAFVILIDRRGFERVGFAVDELTAEGLAHDIRALQREPRF